MVTTSNGLNARRGTVVWGIESFSRDALTALLNDLVAQEESGMGADACVEVKKALDRFTNTATSIPTPFPVNWWQRAIWKELDDFYNLYNAWNNENGAHPEAIEARRLALKKLRNRRAHIASKIRRNKAIIDEELDLNLVRDLYSATGDLVKAMPEIMKNLSAAAARYAKRSKSD